MIVWEKMFSCWFSCMRGVPSCFNFYSIMPKNWQWRC